MSSFSSFLLGAFWGSSASAPPPVAEVAAATAEEQAAVADANVVGGSAVVVATGTGTDADMAPVVAAADEVVIPSVVAIVPEAAPIEDRRDVTLTVPDAINPEVTRTADRPGALAVARPTLTIPDTEEPLVSTPARPAGPGPEETMSAWPGGIVSAGNEISAGDQVCCAGVCVTGTVGVDASSAMADAGPGWTPPNDPNTQRGPGAPTIVYDTQLAMPALVRAPARMMPRIGSSSSMASEPDAHASRDVDPSDGGETSTAAMDVLDRATFKTRLNAILSRKQQPRERPSTAEARSTVARPLVGDKARARLDALLAEQCAAVRLYPWIVSRLMADGIISGPPGPPGPCFCRSACPAPPSCEDDFTALAMRDVAPAVPAAPSAPSDLPAAAPLFAVTVKETKQSVRKGPTSSRGPVVLPACPVPDGWVVDQGGSVLLVTVPGGAVDPKASGSAGPKPFWTDAVRKREMDGQVAELKAENQRLRLQIVDVKTENQRLQRNINHKDTLLQQLKDKHKRHAEKMQRANGKLDEAVQELDARNREAQSKARLQGKKHRLEKQTIRARCKRTLQDPNSE